jgi:hypothetical protein
MNRAGSGTGKGRSGAEPPVSLEGNRRLGALRRIVSQAVTASMFGFRKEIPREGNLHPLEGALPRIVHIFRSRKGLPIENAAIMRVK